jgi:hypothetical protein
VFQSVQQHMGHGHSHRHMGFIAAYTPDTTSFSWFLVAENHLR